MSKHGRKNFTYKDEDFKEEEDSTLTLTLTKPRMIPKSTIVEPSQPQTKQLSAPLDIPDWSKIYGNINPSSPSSWVHHHHHHHHDDQHDGDDDDDGWVPPHEYLAKKLARSKISSFSVYEGIGRTLKGRDLSKVRNAVLTKTGFLESSS